MRRRGFAAILFTLTSACTAATPGRTTPAGTAREPHPASTRPTQQREAHAAAFDRADRRARTVIWQIRCAQQVAGLRSGGVFGPPDSLGGIGQCTAVDGGWVGVFFDTDTLFRGVSRFSAVDIATSRRRAAPVDTTAILAMARATRAAQVRGADAYARAQREYAPMAIRLDADTIEVWLVPPAVLTGPPLTVGGERGYVFSPDGRTLVREVDAFERLRTFALPDTGLITIPSGEATVPSLTELMLANLLHSSGRRVTIEMPVGGASLVGEGRNAVWVHSGPNR